MQNYAYLIALLIALLGMAALDYRYRLAWFGNRHRTMVIIAASVVFFLVWDITLIVSGVASTNQSWVTGLYLLTPDLPVEELLFLTLLSYQTLLLWRWQCSRTSA